MNDVKVSVIMPVYNVENYVGRAIESIQNQTLTDWEFFAVDDGTPDNSGKICDEYAAKDPRIKVIHKENGGAPSARNVAIDKAVGKYMYFMDSDDWAEKTMLQEISSALGQIVVTSRVRIGDVIARNICDTGVNIICTSDRLVQPY